MKRGFEFLSKDKIGLKNLVQIEQNLNFNFPNKFKEFVTEYSFSSDAIVLEMYKDELRGFEFPAEAVLFEPTTKDANPLYFQSFRDLVDIGEELKENNQDDLLQSKGLVVIGYSTVGEKICLGVKDGCLDEIWRVNDDSISKNKYQFLAFDIFEFVKGLISKRV